MAQRDQPDQPNLPDARQRWQAVRPPKLPVYTGDIDGCELDDFTREAHRIVHHYQLQDLGGEAAEWVIQSLEGSARREVTSRPHAETGTANQVLNVLEATFGEQRTTSSLLSSFHSRRQGANEGVLNFAHSLLSQQNRLNAIEANTITNNILRDRFVDGLQPPALRRDVRRYLREHAGATFVEIRTEALRWMREDADLDVRTEQVAATPSARDMELEQLKQQIRELTKRTAEMQVELDRRPSAAPHPQSAPAGRQYGPKCCWLCNEMGHLQARCPLKAQFLQSRPNPTSSHSSRFNSGN
jgi:hypothetical protein